MRESDKPLLPLSSAQSDPLLYSAVALTQQTPVRCLVRRLYHANYLTRLGIQAPPQQAAGLCFANSKAC